MSDLQSRLQNAVGDAYRIVSELGGGGMSRVFLAEEPRLDRKVVIKLLPPEMGAGVNVERFEREIRLAAKLQHPHIVPLLTADSQGDLLWYVMPFIEGESLRAKLAREGELPIGDAVRILKEVIDAVQYAHSNRVVHRDIKPDNVLISGRHAVVTDFGVAKAVSASTGESSLTSLGVALGTPAYMSPEQASADPHVDHRADIYALGAMAYEMLTGRPPFTGTNAQQILAAHMTREPEPVTTLRGTVPPGLSEVILRCLHKKPADRFQRAEEIIPHLDAILTPSGGMTPTGTQPVPAIDYQERVRQAHPARVTGLYALASLGALVIVYALVTAFGLPGWVLAGAVGLLLVGLPIMLLTGQREREVAVATMTGIHVPTPTGVERHLTWRRSLLGGGLAFGTLALVSTSYMGMRAFGIGPAATLVTSGVLANQERVVLAEFENVTADSTLGETVTELFRIDISQSPTITVLDPAQVTQVLTLMKRPVDAPVTEAIALQVAERQGIKAVVSGEIRPIGTGFVLAARLIETSSGEALWSGREQAADGNALVPAIDRLSADMRERIGESLKTIRSDPPLEAVTTRSHEALRRYAEGVQAFNQAQYERAFAALEQAVAADSLFAMAYRKLGVAANNSGLRGIEFRDSMFTRAFELRDRLTERERLITEGSYYSYTGDDQPRAMAAYETLLDKYPNDQAGLNNLAIQYSNEGRSADALALRLRSVANGQAPPVTYTSVINQVGNLVGVDSAEVIVNMFEQDHPGHPTILSYRFDVATARGQYQLADEILDSQTVLLRGDPLNETGPMYNRSVLARLHGQVDQWLRLEAEADAKSAAARPTRQRFLVRDSTFVARSLADLGLEDRARSLMDWALANFPDDSLRPARFEYLDLTAFYARLGDADRARTYFHRWEAEADSAEFGDDFNAVRATFAAELALAEGRYDDAFAALHASFDTSTRRRESKENQWPDDAARFHDLAGNADSAIVLYERWLNRDELTRVFADAGQMWLVLRRLGELYEARGERGRAVEYYDRLVELWADADPELQGVVTDLKARIARLTGEPR